MFRNEFDTTIELHNRLISLNELNENAKVFYASLGVSEYAYHKYNENNVLAAIEPTPLGGDDDDDYLAIANYCEQKTKHYFDFNEVEIEKIKQIKAVIHNYAQFQNYDYEYEVNAFLENKFDVYSSFFDCEKDNIIDYAKNTFSNCIVTIIDDNIIKISREL